MRIRNDLMRAHNWPILLEYDIQVRREALVHSFDPAIEQPLLREKALDLRALAGMNAIAQEHCAKSLNTQTHHAAGHPPPAP